MKKSLILLATILAFNLVKAQVVVNNSGTVANYIQNVLLGGGVTVSNITINGGPASVSNAMVGEFTDVTSSVGLPAGMIIGSGDVNLASQPNIGGGSSLGGAGTSGSDPDLLAISTAGIYDECIIEFDFIPIGDTISFNYIFASEEYEEYVCSGYNDVFGFFLSGNNPAGGSYTSQNIALVPNPLVPNTFTTTAVAINTINPGVAGAFGSAPNCAAQDPNWTTYNVFYQTNATTNYEYDGRTVPLPVIAWVYCGQTYHIKIAIADAGDAAFDSGVFFEEGSFSANGSLNATNANVPPNITLCGQPYTVNFSAGPNPPPQSYWDFGDGLGTDTATNPVYTYQDTGTYTVMYIASDTNICINSDTAYFTVQVILNDSLDAQFYIPPYDPCTDSLTIQLAFTGSGADSLFWDMGNGTTFINDTAVTYTYVTPGTYYVSLTAYDTLCNNTFSKIDTIDFNPVYSTVTASPPPNISLCSAPYDVNFTGNTPTPPQSYWDFGDGLGTSSMNNPMYTYGDTGTYTVMYVVIDSSTCNIADTAYFTVSINLEDTLNAQFYIPPYDPCTDSLTIQLDFTGSGADSLFWDMGNGTTFINDTSITYTFVTPGIYVIVFEAYDFVCNKTVTLTDTVVFTPNQTTVNAVVPPNITLCTTPLTVNFTGNSPTPPNSWWNFGDGNTSTQSDPAHTYAAGGVYVVTYVVIDSSTCNIADTATFNVTLIQAPPFAASIDFVPPPPCGMDSFLIDLNYTGIGEDSLIWTMGDGTQFFNMDSITYLYSAPGTYIITLTAFNNLCGDQTIQSEATFTEVSSTESIIPNVFTPNGDGMNDVLQFVGVDQTAEYIIKIFNRWGRLVYEGTDALAHWDGGNQHEGVYFYELRFTDICSDEQRLVKGYVTLFR